MSPILRLCLQPLSICLAVLVLLAVSVVGSPIGSPVSARASPSITSTSAHPLATNSPWELHAAVMPATITDEVYLWTDGDDAELYVGSTRFGLNNEKERLVPIEVGIPQTGIKKIGQVIYPSVSVKEQVLQILVKCGIKIASKAHPVRLCRGNYFQNIIQRLVKVSALNSFEVKDENGGGDLEMTFTSLLRNTGFLGTPKEKKTSLRESNRHQPY
ncbi:hypothetical protein EV368DRAFT_62198 [Lentinula lateritia]|uniref:Uncharacterized protein n=1 Tax=Lentinula aff. lateritia TaxID=2804960 RepID=A0ACC1TS62_9AGAR|nr:hypothetical protein F5876DRAFT_79542 [Lentinula aff. lateritia]KAJ3855796.1 hypothetical protein EV368DRAFT_62198 [Lentinula lateritia]